MVIVILAAGCQSQPAKQSKLLPPLNYREVARESAIKFLDSLHLKDLLDSSKWNLYYYHSHDTVSDDSNKSMNVFSTELKPIYADKVGDTVSLMFDYFSNDTIEMNSYRLFPGTQFKLPEKKFIGFFKGEGYWYLNKYRIEDISPPGTLQYFKANQEKLNPWLLKELKRRNVIK